MIFGSSFREICLQMTVSRDIIKKSVFQCPAKTLLPDVETHFLFLIHVGGKEK